MKSWQINILAIVLISYQINIVAQLPYGAHMAYVRYGWFDMGDNTKAKEEDELLHLVYVDSFYIDRYEVTKSLWDEVYAWAFMNGYDFHSGITGNAPNHPIHSLGWHDAVKWCNARSEKEGMEPAYYINSNRDAVCRTGLIDLEDNCVKWKSGYRLPTEEEWEKAARGELVRNMFPWGMITRHVWANYKSDASDYYDKSATRGYHPLFAQSKTSPVGCLRGNRYGIYDVVGNVWEWCWDEYKEYTPFYYRIQPSSSQGKIRVMRGGSYMTEARFCRVANREACDPYGTLEDYGFRTVRVSQPKWRNMFDISVVQPQLSACPIQKKDGADSLIVITHGWKPDMAWLNEMKDAIEAYLAANGLNNWQVYVHDWREKAQIPIWEGGPSKARENGKLEGEKLGKCLSFELWKEIYLMAHSAGSGLIQAVVLQVENNSPSTITHAVFLDPYIGAKQNGKDEYGKDADWAVNYFARDISVFTDSLLTYAYNVDVSWLDSSKKRVPVARSGGLTTTGDCYEQTSSHSWPHDFVQQTIPPSTVTGAEEFGFLLGFEGKSPEELSVEYPPGSFKALGGLPQVTCLPTSIQPSSSYQLNMYNAAKITAPKGVKFSWYAATMTAQGDQERQLIQNALPAPKPVWFAFELFVTNKINLISFETEFTSGEGSEGLLTVYWNTNEIASIDERFALRERTEHILAILDAMSGILGFRLGAFLSTSSSVIITNVSLGFVGIPEPYMLDIESTSTNTLVLTLTGPSGYNYILENSPNLTDWQVQAILVNTNGTVQYMDHNTDAYMFYRVMGQ